MGIGTGLRRGLVLVIAASFVACGSEPAPTPSGMEADAQAASAEANDRDERAQPARRPASTRRAEAAGANQPPVVRSLQVASSADDPSLWEARIVADDPDGDEITLDITWYVNGRVASEGERTFDPTTRKRGERIHVAVTPHDGKVAGATAESGRMEIANAPPRITSTPSARMHDGVFRYMVEASDPDGDAPLRYQLTKSPAGMRIDPFNGELTWRPDSDQGGEHPVEITVTDNRGAKSTQEFVLPIMAPSAPPAAFDN